VTICAGSGSIVVSVFFLRNVLGSIGSKIAGYYFGSLTIAAMIGAITTGSTSFTKVGLALYITGFFMKTS
jgi:hypothetical protein